MEKKKENNGDCKAFCVTRKGKKKRKKEKKKWTGDFTLFCFAWWHVFNTKNDHLLKRNWYWSLCINCNHSYKILKALNAIIFYFMAESRPACKSAFLCSSFGWLIKSLKIMSEMLVFEKIQSFKNFFSFPILYKKWLFLSAV